MELIKALIFQEVGRLALQAFADARIDYENIAEIASLKALHQIKAIIEDDSLSDFECIESIVLTFEAIGSDSGGRHDFG